MLFFVGFNFVSFDYENFFFFLIFQVLEEAQQMAVEKYGIEDKTNLYIGFFNFSLFFFIYYPW